MTATRESIIYSMCLTYRHDYGLTKTPQEKITDPIGAGMTLHEKQELWDQMAEIFDKDIAPFMEFKK
jgi:hypothetical protein